MNEPIPKGILVAKIPAIPSEKAFPIPAPKIVIKPVGSFLKNFFSIEIPVKAPSSIMKLSKNPKTIYSVIFYTFHKKRVLLLTPLIFIYLLKIEKYEYLFLIHIVHLCYHMFQLAYHNQVFYIHLVA